MARSLRTILNEANPTKIASGLQVARVGSLLGQIPVFYKGAVASHIMTLPESKRARIVLAAFVTAGSVTGHMTPVTGGAPSTGQVGITATGNLVFATADAVTAAEVYYLTVEGEVIEEVVPVVSHVATPSQNRAALLLLEATALAGTLSGAKTVDFRGAAIATTEAGINLLGTGVVFATADAVTSARIKYVATPGVGQAKNALGANLDSVDRNF